METGKLQKMKLTSFADIKYQGSGNDTYTVLINPETYTLNYEVKANTEQASGSGTTSVPFVLSPPQRIEFDFLFDGTGALVNQGVPNPFDITNQDPISKQIDKFKKIVFEITGEIHQPNFVKLEWGDLHFNGKLEKLQLIYKLFKPDGTAIRATAKATFVAATDPNLAEAKQKKSSPDLTHIRIVKAGDTLPLMCHDIYGDSTLYREVARINKIINFRKLNIGLQVSFPPIQKK